MGIYVDDKSMTKKEILDFFKLSPSLIPNVRRKVIEVKTKQVDRDKVRPPKSIGGKPEYLVHVPHLEREVKIRFATSQRKDDNDNWTYPFPKTLTLHPSEDGTCLISDEMEFLFWFLRPMCSQSPFRDKTKAYFYGFQDNDARAVADMDREEKYIDAMSIIVGKSAWTDIQLKHLAKGLNIQGVDDMSPMVVKSELKKKAFKDPLDFFNKANSREILFSGKIQECIDRDILKLQSKLGMQRWYLNGEEILPIQYGQDPLNELKNHMAEKYYLYQDALERALKGATLATYLNNPINDEAFSNEAKAMPNKVLADLSPEQIEDLKKMRTTDWQEAKIAKLAAYDINDPKLHQASRKSYNENIDLINAYKLEQLQLEQV